MMHIKHVSQCLAQSLAPNIVANIVVVAVI